MRLRRMLVALPLSLVLAAGCGDDDNDVIGPDEIQLADLVGSWTVTGLTFQADGNADLEEDFLSTTGATGTIQIAENGAYSLTLTVGPIEQTETGTVAVENGRIVTTPTSETNLFVITDGRATVDGDVLTVTSEDQQYDFESDEAGEVNADLTATFRRSGGS